MNNLSYYALSALAVLITLTIHEYAHAYAAYKMGDHTAKNLGRLTLNPIKHLDPIGAICMLLFHIGWAKPVPINARNFKNPKKGFALSALAGPLSNVILGFVFSGGFILLLYILKLNLPEMDFYTVYSVLYRDYTIAPEAFSLKLLQNFVLFLEIFFSVNIGLGIFNLLPIPPFDGSRLLNVIFPPKIYFGIMKHERKIYFAVLAWLLIGDYAAMAVRNTPIFASNPILYGLAGILSLSNIIGTCIGFIGNLMLDFWRLIIPLSFG